MFCNSISWGFTGHTWPSKYCYYYIYTIIIIVSRSAAVMLASNLISHKKVNNFSCYVACIMNFRWDKYMTPHIHAKFCHKQWLKLVIVKCCYRPTKIRSFSYTNVCWIFFWNGILYITILKITFNLHRLFLSLIIISCQQYSQHTLWDQFFLIYHSSLLWH